MYNKTKRRVRRWRDALETGWPTAAAQPSSPTSTHLEKHHMPLSLHRGATPRQHSRRRSRVSRTTAQPLSRRSGRGQTEPTSVPQFESRFLPSVGCRARRRVGKSEESRRRKRRQWKDLDSQTPDSQSATRQTAATHLILVLLRHCVVPALTRASARSGACTR